AEDLKVSRDGNVDVTIEGVAKERAAFLFHAHDSHRQAANLESLSNRVSVGVVLVFDIAAKHYNHRRALYFIVGNEASGFDSFVFDVDHVCAGAKHDRAGKLDPVLLQVNAAARFGADFSARMAMITYPLVVVPVDSFVATVATLKFLVVHVTRESHARDHEVITAQHLRTLLYDIRIDPRDERPHT